MISNDERRRAVAGLREASTGAYRHVDALDVIANSVGVDTDGKFDYEIENETYATLANFIDCPKCGATPCHQKWKQHKTVNSDKMMAIEDADPVDAVYCRKCDLVFCVSKFEHDDTYITDWDEIEMIPRYCPQCGTMVTIDDT